MYVGGCQNYGPFWDPYYNTAPNISGTQKGTIILTTTHVMTVVMMIVMIIFNSNNRRKRVIMGLHWKSVRILHGMYIYTHT